MLLRMEDIELLHNVNSESSARPSKRRIVSLALHPELLVKLDEQVRVTKTSRNWLVERILEGFLNNLSEAE
jgi:hypothetical protein